MFGFIGGIVVLILICVGVCWIGDKKMRDKEAKLRMAHKRKMLKKMKEAKEKKDKMNRSGSSDLMSTDTSVQSDAYLNMNRESEGFRASFGRPSRVRMKGGKLTEYLTKIRLSKQLSLNDMGSINESAYGSLALKKSLSSENNISGIFGGNSPLKRKKLSDTYKVSDDLEIGEEDEL
jgi:hypothetical protein